jgi:hypothetical protein
MKSARFANTVALLAVILILPLASAARAQLTLDDFSTGPYKRTLSSGQDTNTQAGTMIGGNRLTVFFVCTAPCGASNPFAQSASFQLRQKTKLAPSALIFSAGYKVAPRLDVEYGSVAPLNLDLGTNYDRIRVNFDGSDLFVNFNILVFTGTNYSQTGCNLAPSIAPISIDFPFAYFTKGANFTNISVIDFIFQSASGIGANDWAVTSFQAIPTGDPPAQITCYGLGT